MPVYLDYCASSPIDKRVLSEMTHIFTDVYGNADSRTHLFGNHAKEVLEKSRRTVAELLSVDKSEIIFTSGATESDNMAILGLKEYGEETGKRHFITTAIEHKAVLEPMKYLASHGFDVDIIDPDRSGRVNTDLIMSKVRKDTLCVSVMHVNNETGIIQPVEEIGQELDQTDTLFHIDAAQSFGKLNHELRNMKYNMLSISGHKIMGPQGIGVLVLKRKKYKRPPIKPLLLGGPQEYGYRPGTTPVPLAAGLALAAELAEREHEERKRVAIQIRSHFFERINNLAYQINGDQAFCMHHIINVSFPGVDAESVFSALSSSYAFSNGSACNSSNYKPSYVLEAMGLDENVISSALRISWGSDPVDFSELVQYIEGCK